MITHSLVTQNDPTELSQIAITNMTLRLSPGPVRVQYNPYYLSYWSRDTLIWRWWQIDHENQWPDLSICWICSCKLNLYTILLCIQSYFNLIKSRGICLIILLTFRILINKLKNCWKIIHRQNCSHKIMKELSILFSLESSNNLGTSKESHETLK